MVVGLIVCPAPGYLIRETIVRGFPRSAAHDLVHRSLSQTPSQSMSLTYVLLPPVTLNSGHMSFSQASALWLPTSSEDILPPPAGQRGQALRHMDTITDASTGDVIYHMPQRNLWLETGVRTTPCGSNA